METNFLLSSMIGYPYLFSNSIGYNFLFHSRIGYPYLFSNSIGSGTLFTTGKMALSQPALLGNVENEQVSSAMKVKASTLSFQPRTYTLIDFIFNKYSTVPDMIRFYSQPLYHSKPCNPYFFMDPSINGYNLSLVQEEPWVRRGSRDSSKDYFMLLSHSCLHLGPYEPHTFGNFEFPNMGEQGGIGVPEPNSLLQSALRHQPLYCCKGFEPFNFSPNVCFPILAPQDPTHPMQLNNLRCLVCSPKQV